jgi:urease accessory protein
MSEYRSVAKVGFGGPVGSGKTALIRHIVPRLRERGLDVGVIANDILTQEDAKAFEASFEGIVPNDLIAGVETGSCPHTGIREDPSMNLQQIDTFLTDHPDLDVVFIESGGDNLGATFNPELADYFIFVISVAEGDDIPRKRGPGITEADLLVINKTDLAPYVDADLETMDEDTKEVRTGPHVFTDCRGDEGVDDVIDHVDEYALFAT